ncbi:MAG: hypothetical protein SPK28_02985, partial [Bacilli bacterium]|nr:hypothetical protein [Bacilli bacterium]
CVIIKTSIKSAGKVKSGHYSNVNVGIIRTNSKIATIFPMSPQKDKKVVALNEQKTNRNSVRRKKKYRWPKRCFN